MIPARATIGSNSSLAESSGGGSRRSTGSVAVAGSAAQADSPIVDSLEVRVRDSVPIGIY